MAEGQAETPRQLPRRASCPRWDSPWPRAHVLDPGCMAGAGAQRARVSLAPEEGALDKLDKERWGEILGMRFGEVRSDKM